MITITKEEYLALRIASLNLSMLEAGGVDNWEWHSESLRPGGEKTFVQQCDDIKADLEK